MDCPKSVTLSPGASSIKRNRSVKAIKLDLAINKLKSKAGPDICIIGKNTNLDKRSGSKFSSLKKHKTSCDEMKDIKKNESSDAKVSVVNRPEVEENLSSPLQKVNPTKCVLSPRSVPTIISISQSNDLSDSDVVEEKFSDSLNENFVSKCYIMWENNSNLCWLDASMSLIVHNHTLRKVFKNGLSVKINESPQIMKIFKSYYEAVYVINDRNLTRRYDPRLKIAKEKLKNIRESTLLYLQPFMKCKEGEPDSAFCSLYNLIAKDENVRNHFETEYAILRDCKKCNVRRTLKHKKPIITLSKVKSFEPSAPVSLFQCSSCKERDQEMVLIYKSLPPCLIFHFENGAGTGAIQHLEFDLQGRMYKLTGLMTMEKISDSTINHYITWIRDPATNKWLECNDLKPEILTFVGEQPDIKLQNVHIIMFEAADELGIITNNSAVLKSVLCDEDALEKKNDDVPFIDITGEESNSKSNSITNDISTTVDRKINSIESNAAALLRHGTTISLIKRNQITMDTEHNAGNTEHSNNLDQSAKVVTFSELGNNVYKLVRSYHKVSDDEKLSDDRPDKNISENNPKCITEKASPLEPENVEIAETLIGNASVKRKLFLDHEICVKKFRGVTTKNTSNEISDFQRPRDKIISPIKHNPYQSEINSDASGTENEELSSQMLPLEPKNKNFKVPDQNELKIIPKVMKEPTVDQLCEQRKLENIIWEFKNNFTKIEKLEERINALETRIVKDVEAENECPQKLLKSENSFGVKEQSFMKIQEHSENKLSNHSIESSETLKTFNKCLETSGVDTSVLADGKISAIFASNNKFCKEEKQFVSRFSSLNR
ncbi:Ubiquitin-specific peptidase-like protein 1, partial [Stegodyphus mimosarum]